MLLNTIDGYCWKVIEQAASLGMMNKGWAWIVTDGTTTGEIPANFRKDNFNTITNVSNNGTMV